MAERGEEAHLAARPERSDVGSWAPPGPGAATINRISWGAIFAGTAVALVVQLLLSLLGLAIGLSIVEPLTGGNPWRGIGIGAGIWWIISALLALFIGGWTAGRLAGMPLRKDAILHGIIVWALLTVITFYLVISGVGTIISGALNVVQQGVQLLGSGIGAVAPQEGLTLEQIQAEAAELMRTADPGATQDLAGALDRLLRQGSEADRQTAITILTQQTQMSEEEARRTLAQYEQRYRQTRERVAQVTRDATDAVAIGAWWAFFAMLLGAVAAGAGGAVGAPRDLPASPGVRRE